MRENKSTDLVFGPIELVTKMFEFQQERVMNQLQPQPTRQRRNLLGGVDENAILAAAMPKIMDPHRTTSLKNQGMR